MLLLTMLIVASGAGIMALDRSSRRVADYNAAVRPGTFNGQDVRGIASETGAGAGEDCSFGGGSFDATFQILAIDDQTVEARLCNVNDLFFDTDPQLEGSFSADRCPL